MGYHTFEVEQAEKLEDSASRYRYLSAEELLWSVSPSDEEVIADLGSGTGFYTDDLAPHVGEVYAVDVQEAMHDYYRDKGVPVNVELITAEISDLPFDTSFLDVAVSTMTYHEFAGSDALRELARAICPDGRLVIADWSAEELGETGPPLDERFAAEETASSLRNHGFKIRHQATRTETFILVAVRE
ncbi:class I SAM-dependent methyltransferase [Natrinema amylolyticum]|uniref:class I SAM-dependent methyltransferase n=1 Tax=Natrinema amylolyticum TaxID=2878679 RepID=UPI001CF9F603|nr:class I SAM-dependent methyltransferase [Natrinema amylolyticum]